jgi:hypothetical protein
MELISVNIKNLSGINLIDPSKLLTSNPFEREEIACSFDEEMIHFHVIDQILNMRADLSHKRKLILASVPDEKVVLKRLEVFCQTSPNLPIVVLLEEIVSSLDF